MRCVRQSHKGICNSPFRLAREVFTESLSTLYFLASSQRILPVSASLSQFSLFSMVCLGIRRPKHSSSPILFYHEQMLVRVAMSRGEIRKNRSIMSVSRLQELWRIKTTNALVVPLAAGSEGLLSNNTQFSTCQ